MNYSNKQAYFSTANCPPCNQVSNCPPCQPCRVQLPPPQAPEIPAESQLIYIPYSRKVIDYVQQERIEKIPVERTVTDYEQVRIFEQVPIEKRVISYYAVEHVIDYSADYRPISTTDYVDKEIISHQVQYVPYQRQIVHYPHQAIYGSPSQALYTTATQALTGSGTAVVPGANRYQMTKSNYIGPQAYTATSYNTGNFGGAGGAYNTGGSYISGGGSYAQQGGSGGYSYGNTLPLPGGSYYSTTGGVTSSGHRIVGGTSYFNDPMMKASSSTNQAL